MGQQSNRRTESTGEEEKWPLSANRLLNSSRHTEFQLRSQIGCWGRAKDTKRAREKDDSGLVATLLCHPFAN
jgi:hypothetical protein